MTTEETIAALDRGEVRVAEPDGGDWIVHDEVQAAILDYFRSRQMEPREVGPFEYHDKIPLKTGYEQLGVRALRRREPRIAADLAQRLLHLGRLGSVPELPQLAQRGDDGSARDARPLQQRPLQVRMQERTPLVDARGRLRLRSWRAAR